MVKTKRSGSPYRTMNNFLYAFVEKATTLSVAYVVLVVFLVIVLGILGALVSVKFGGSSSGQASLNNLQADAAFLDYAKSNLPSYQEATGDSGTLLPPSQYAGDICAENFVTIALDGTATFSSGRGVAPGREGEVFWRVYPDSAEPAYPIDPGIVWGRDFSVNFKTIGKANVVATWQFNPGESISEICKVRVVKDLASDPYTPSLTLFFNNKQATNELFIQKYQFLTLGWTSKNVRTCNIYAQDALITRTFTSSQSTDAARSFSGVLDIIQRDMVVTGTCEGPYGPVTTQAKIRLTDYLCGPYIQDVKVGQPVTLNNGDSTSSMYWSAPDGTIKSGQGTKFTTTFSTVGKKSVTAGLLDKIGSPTEFPPYTCFVNVTATSFQDDSASTEPYQIAPNEPVRDAGYPTRSGTSTQGTTGGTSSGWGFTRFIRNIFTR